MKTVTFNIPDDRGKLYEVIKYPAGEIQVRLTEDGIFTCFGREEYVIAANPIPDIIELAQLKSALDGVRNWHHRVLELMYMPYARADRRFQPGDSLALQAFADLINVMGFDVIYTFDVHNEVQAKKFFRDLVNLDPIIAYDQLGPIIRDLGATGLCLIAPDKGATSRYDLAVYGLPILVGEKTRDPKTGALSGFSINPEVAKHKKGLIVDDICDGGGTFVGLAKEVQRVNPAIELYLYVSHGIFSKGLGALFPSFKYVYLSDFTIKNQISTTFQKLEE